jgi:glucose-1-phosphate cytidylyltransferase
MKVVLFCGGLGMRIRDNENIPKPMMTIGYRPVMWHLMKYYAHFGFKDFILCLGYRADYIKNYFLTYNECLSNDLTLSEGGRKLELIKSDIGDWRITFVDTGLNSNIGQRLKAVEQHLDGEEYFLANYADGLSDLNLTEQLDHYFTHKRIASFLSVKPNLSFHLVNADEQGRVKTIEDFTRSHIRINGGFFIFHRDVFRYMGPGEELVREPFQRMVADDQLLAYEYDGFWQAMDTFKDRQGLEELCAAGSAPWELWKAAGAASVAERLDASMKAHQAQAARRSSLQR